MKVSGLLLALVPVLAGAASGQGSACLPQGLDLAVDGGRIGDDLTVTLTGLPFAPGLVGMDLGGGPTATPFGPVCLDLSPALVAVPIALGSSGSLQIVATLPPTPGLGGLTLYFQSFVVDATQPSGVALSNGVEVDPFPPRLYVFDPGLLSPFGGSPGNVVLYDAFEDQVEQTLALPTDAVDTIYLPDLGWLAVLMPGGDLRCYDGETGAEVASVAIPAATNPPDQLLDVAPGVVVAVHHGYSSPFGTVTGEVSVALVQTGTVPVSVPLASATPTDAIAAPGTPLVYLRSGYDVVGFDWGTGLEVSTTSVDPALVHGPVVDWVIDGGRLITLQGGLASTFGGVTAPPALNAVDLATGQAVLGAPVALTSGTGLASAVDIGPVLAGKAVLVLFPSGGEVVVADEAGFFATSTLSVDVGTSELALSAGGTEWLLLDSGTSGSPLGTGPSPGTLQKLEAASLTWFHVALLPAEGQANLTVLPSKSLRRVHLTSGASTLLSFDTDPATGSVVTTPLPLSTAPTKIVTN